MSKNKEISSNFEREQNLSRRDFLKLVAALGLFAAGGSVLLEVDKANAESNKEIAGPYPEGTKDLYQAWNRLKENYIYEEDKGGETWQLEDEGDCEDFLLKFFYEELEKSKYSAQLAKVIYVDSLQAFSGRIKHENSGGHMVMFLVNEQGQFFVIDNGAWGGITGPYVLNGGFKSIKERAQALAENQDRRKKYPLNTIAERKVQKIEVKSLPSRLPEGGVETLRKEGGWSLAYSSD